MKSTAPHDAVLTPDHGLDRPQRRWSDRIATAVDPEKEPDAIIPLRPMVSALLREEQSCPHQQQAERHEAQQLADSLVREAVRNLLPASAMLYVPVDELAMVHAKLKQAVQSMLADAHDTAGAHGKAFCRETLTRTLQHKLKNHLKHDRSAQQLLMRHSAQHHYAPYMHASAPETGMHTVADIHSRYGGIDKNHGNYHGSCHP